MYKSYLQSDDPMIRRKYWLKRPKKAGSDSEAETKKE